MRGNATRLVAAFSLNMKQTFGVFFSSRYLGPLGAENGMPKEKYQGGYQCSIRSFTEWEQSGAPHGNGHIEDHPNYWSRFMNQKIEDGMPCCRHYF
jgi:hypothetical protein